MRRCCASLAANLFVIYIKNFDKHFFFFSSEQHGCPRTDCAVSIETPETEQIGGTLAMLLLGHYVVVVGIQKKKKVICKVEMDA